MIFVTLGSQKFQFNRLLKEIDELIEEGEIKEEVFAQIGYSDYKPKNYKFKKFLDRSKFRETMNKCDKVITHGGTGAIIGAIKNNKKVIAIPRLLEFGEHVDNHQVEIVNQFSNMNLIIPLNDRMTLMQCLESIEHITLNSYESKTRNIIESIEFFVSNKC